MFTHGFLQLVGAAAATTVPAAAPAASTTRAACHTATVTSATFDATTTVEPSQTYSAPGMLSRDCH